MASGRSSKDEIWIERNPGRPRRVLRGVSARLGRATAKWEDAWQHEPRRAADSPAFRLSGYDATFDELEAILNHPDVVEAIERTPGVALHHPPPPPTRAPHGSAAFGARPRARPATVYDVVPVGLELDLLELRLVQLWDLVDRFIVVEAPRSYGGLRKPLFVDRRAARFDRFRNKLTCIVLDDGSLDAAYPDRRRTPTDFAGEYAFRAAMWRAVREHVVFAPGAVVIAADLDEFPPRNLVHWIRHDDVNLPLRLRMRSLRYTFRWEDPETNAELVIFSPRQFPQVDAAPDRLRVLQGPTVGATGATHLTSFLDPPALIAKFAMTTDWEPGIIPYLRNEHDETARMMARGRWFARPLRPYDPENDVENLVPWAARVNRMRYPAMWGDTPLTRS